MPDLIELVSAAGISRDVLVSRLCSLQRSPESLSLLYSPGLSNMAIGIGVWGPSGSYLRAWPMFSNFDGGIAPSFLLKLDGHQMVPAERLFSDQQFYMRGGANHVVTEEVFAGTQKVPNAKKINIEYSVEVGPWKEGSE